MIGALLASAFKVNIGISTPACLIASILVNAAANVPLDQRFGRLEKKADVTAGRAG